ncbi:hypothetical protein HRTV-24_gp134 [Halorubrum virus HRTV-24]|nr:hypothetical protein HRTV-24_gp134 [Halorubrum virus HRTV-24]
MSWSYFTRVLPHRGLYPPRLPLPAFHPLYTLTVYISLFFDMSPLVSYLSVRFGACILRVCRINRTTRVILHNLYILTPIWVECRLTKAAPAPLGAGRDSSPRSDGPTVARTVGTFPAPRSGEPSGVRTLSVRPSGGPPVARTQKDGPPPGAGTKTGNPLNAGYVAKCVSLRGFPSTLPPYDGTTTTFPPNGRGRVSRPVGRFGRNGPGRGTTDGRNHGPKRNPIRNVGPTHLLVKLCD